MIHRKKEEVEVIDVGKPFGMPEGSMLIQWMVSALVGDKRYRHRFAVRRYILKPVEVETIPLHSHRYVQALTVISGILHCETPESAIRAYPGDTVYFYQQEQHKAVPVGNDTVEVICVIDCPEGEDNCLPRVPKDIETT